MNDSISQEGVKYPLTHATVLRLVSRMPIQSPEKFEEKGTLVKLKKDSKYFSLNPEAAGVGETIGTKPDEPGWTYVRFPKSGLKNRYRIGSSGVDEGACDLELAESETMTYAVTILAGQTIEVPVTGFAVEPGDILKLASNPIRVVAMEKCVASGVIAFVTEIISGGMAIVDCQSQRKTVFTGKYEGKLEQNGKVVLDASQSVIVGNFGLEDDSFSVKEEVTVTLDDICGLEEPKARFREALEDAARYPKIYAAYREEPPAGYLVCGPPGCGKTMLAKAAYASMVGICKTKNAPISQGFILVSGPEILSKWVGSAEATIRHIFAKARKFHEKWNIRPLVFFDEAEAIMANRDSGISSDVLKSIVPAFLAEMQGVRDSGALVMLATNKPKSLDPAIVRDGRIDATIEVGRPDRVAVAAIFRNNMKGVILQTGVSLEELAGLAVEEIFSPKRSIFAITRVGDDGKPTDVTFAFKDIVSGAMVANIVKEAKRIARNRDKARGEDSASGVSKVDVSTAVEANYRQKLILDHEEALGDFVRDFKDKILKITKLVQAQA